MLSMHSPKLYLPRTQLVKDRENSCSKNTGRFTRPFDKNDSYKIISRITHQKTGPMPVQLVWKDNECLFALRSKLYTF